MSLVNWLSRLARRPAARRARTPVARSRPRLEALEGRCVPSCMDLTGTITEAPIATFPKTGTVSGGLAGSEVVIQLPSTQPGQSGRILTERTITTDAGTLTLLEEGEVGGVTPQGTVVNVRSTVIGGTGALAGATGQLELHGYVDPATGLITFSYHGQLCTPDAP
jgi:hypothetical protein